MSNKLDRLVQLYGTPMHEILENAMFDGICPAICMSPDCDNTEDMEPDQTRGYCSVCGKNTMKSALVLAGVI